MNSNRLNLVLAAVLALVLTFSALLRPDATQPNWEFLPEMKRSPAVQAFEVSDRFANGRALQWAVPGTIPRGHQPLHFTASKEDAARAGVDLRNPYQVRIAAPPANPPAAGKPVDPLAELAASVQRGEAVYRVSCQSCHGATGAGDGPVAQRGFPPPPPLPTGKSVQMPDGQLFHILTYGQGSMSPMAAQLDRDQRWDVINFVRSLQTPAATAASPPATPPAPSPPAPP